MLRRAVVLSAACVATAVAGGFVPGAASAASPPAEAHCALPAPGHDFERRSPDQLGINPVALANALGFATQRNAQSIRVYRHNCLAGAGPLDGLNNNLFNDVWSTTKGVLSVLVGRAQRLGLIDLNASIGRYLPQADAAHRRITVKNLLTETSGLHFIWTAELHSFHPDTVKFTLGLPFDHEPGTFFEYGQLTVNLLAGVLEKAVGGNLQAFAQRELFGPLGIAPSEWMWLKDNAGNTQAWAHLFMSPRNLARIGHLMLRRGEWRGQRLLNARYVREATTPTKPNPSYGYLLWPNREPEAVTPSIPERKVLHHRIITSAPKDMYAFIGFRDQLVFVIPSLDMVIVRTGEPGNLTTDVQTAITANTGDWLHEFFRYLMRGVRGANVPDPGPFHGDAPAQFDIHYFVDAKTIAWSLGLGQSG
jgi:CubicO group peptidase (beta-lactamase class C family)